MQKKRIYSIDVLRLYLIIVIVLAHNHMTLEPGPETAVLCFFVISGFFLGKKFSGTTREGAAKPEAWQYTLEHVRSFYPHLVFSVTIYYLYRLTRYILVSGIIERSPTWLLDAFSDLYHLIPEYTLTLSMSHKFMSANFALWQLSSIIICGYIIYALLRRDEHLARTILLPVSFLMCESLMFYETDWYVNVGPAYMALVNGFGPMVAGLYIYYFTETRAYAELKKHRFLMDAACLVSVAAIVCFKLSQRIVYFPIAVVLLNCWDPDSLVNKLLNHSCFRRSGKLAIAIVLDHMMINNFVINPLSRFLTGRGVVLTEDGINIIYMILVLIYSSCTTVFLEKFMAYRARRKAARS